MNISLKPLKNQVIVITGASSGIGLVTARIAAKQGAKLVVAARNEDALRQLSKEIRSNGGQATYVVADVGKEEVNRIAESAIAEFGGFDTWVNNAGISIFGRCMEVSIPDMKRMFDTDFWGVAKLGDRAAANHYIQRGSAGALINVGSLLERSRGSSSVNLFGSKTRGSWLDRCFNNGVRGRQSSCERDIDPPRTH